MWHVLIESASVDVLDHQLILVLGLQFLVIVLVLGPQVIVLVLVVGPPVLVLVLVLVLEP